MPHWSRSHALVSVAAVVMSATPTGTATVKPAPVVVFVCEHGSAKSLVASSLFQRMANEKGLAARAISRGTDPDASVPPAVVEALRADGFDVAAFRPRALTSADVAGAARVVAIGVDLGPLGAKAGPRAVRWDDVPPVSTNYSDARRDLVARIERLLEELRTPARARR